MGDTLLSMTKLTKHFPIKGGVMGRPVGWVHAVEDVELHVSEGETLGIVGESGCGKSTLARLVLGLLRPTKGEVVPGPLLAPQDANAKALVEYNQSQLHAFRANVQVVFQDPLGALDPRMLVKDIVAEPLRLHRPPGKGSGWLRMPILGRILEPLLDPEMEPKVLALLEQVGLGKQHLFRFPHQFSGGQRQRITVARALALKPRLLVLDEPTSALDVSVQAQILNLLRSLQAELKLTYLLISHDLAVVRHLSNRVAVMYLGRVMELAPTETLFERATHPYTLALLSAVPDVDDEGRKRIVLEGDVPDPADPPEGCPFHPRCRLVQERCRRELPELKPVFDPSDPGAPHLVACHIAHEGRADGQSEGGSGKPGPELMRERGTAQGPPPDDGPAPDGPAPEPGARAQ